MSLMNVLGYARLSRATDESTSIEKQAAIISDFCSRKGWHLVGVIEDPDLSATSSRLERPGLSEVRQRIASGEAAAVVVWRLDRITRNVVDYSKLVDEGIFIVSASEDIDATTSSGKMVAQLVQIVAEAESRNTSDRVKATVRHLRRSGKWPGGARPYGYRSIPHPSGKGRALAPDPDEAAVVRRMADEVIEGRSLYGIAQRLNVEGVPAPKGAGWRTNTIRRILTGDTILGRMVEHGELILDSEGVPVVFWPPLVDLGTAARLRAILPRAVTKPKKTPATAAVTEKKKEKRTQVSRRRADRLLSGLLACPGCGSRLVARSLRYPKSGQMVAFYGCSNKARALPCPRSVFIRADRLEAEVENRFLSAFGAVQVVEERVSYHPVAGLAEAESALQETAAAMIKPGADVVGLSGKLQELAERRDRLAAIPSEPTREFVETGQTFAETWANADTHTRRSLLSSAPVRIMVDHATTKAWDPSRIHLEPTHDYLAGQLD